MRMNIWKTPVLCLAALTLAALAQPALADHDVDVERDVRVKVIKCDGDDCSEMIENLVGGEHAEVIVGGDNAKRIVVRKIHCEDGACEEHGGMHNMVFVDEDGDVKVMTGDDSHAWVSHSSGIGLGGGYLGVGLTELTPELREHFGVPADAGVMVSKVMDDSPAFKVGLEAGDIITEVDGESIANGAALAEAIRGHAEGEEVVLSVWREGAARLLTAAVEERGGIPGQGHLGHLGHLGRLGRLGHAGHLGHVRDMKKLHKIMIHCDSDDEDCEPNVDISSLDGFDCGGSEECEIRVQCKDGGCTCSINGEDADCEGIPGLPGG